MKRLQVDGRDLLWPGVEGVWSETAPVLFPVVGRSPDNHLWTEHGPEPMPIHGFARTSMFELLDRGPTHAEYRLRTGGLSIAAYPHAVTLTVRYTVSSARLSIAFEVLNEGLSSAAFQLGWHPGLRVSPDYALDLVLTGAEGLEARRLTAEGMLTQPIALQAMDEMGNGERRLRLSADLFAQGALILAGAARQTTATLPKAGVRLSAASQDPTNWTVWSIPGQPFLCIEPTWGLPPVLAAPSRLQDRPGAMTLDPRGGRRFCVHLDISRV